MTRAVRRPSVLLAVLLSLVPPSALAETHLVTVAEVQNAVRERATYGLPAREDLVRELMTSGLDVGSQAWGMPLTAAEMESLDLRGRMEFVIAAETVLDYARALPTYGGAFVDQLDNGSLTILLTDDDAEARTRLAALSPRGDREVRTAVVQYSYSTLDSAARRAMDLVPSFTGGVNVNWAAVDERANRVLLAVDAIDQSAAVSAIAGLSAELGAPVSVTTDSEFRPEACTSRFNCHSPTRDGIVIANSEFICGLGFAVTKAGDEQFFTAGHCGTEGGSTWFHPDVTGLALGLKKQSAFVTNGHDIMRVDFASDTQASTLIYGEGARVVTGTAHPTSGASLCASYSWTQALDCGSVASAGVYYSAEGTIVYGSTLNGFFSQEGDSGSPYYQRGTGTATALGIHSGASGATRFMARVKTVLQNWGWSIYT